MKFFLLIVLVIQLLATNKLYSQGLIQKSTKVLTTYTGVTVDQCDAYTQNIEYYQIFYKLESVASKQGTCKIWSKECESSKNLPCKACERHGKTVFFWNIKKSVTWVQARNYCKMQGGRLVVVKDAEKQALIKTIAKRLIPDEKKEVAFWIGFYRETSKSTWKYVDGTVLGSYSDWTPGRPQPNVNCGEISNGAKFKWRWDNDDCKGDPGWIYYPMCEATLGFLNYD